MRLSSWTSPRRDRREQKQYWRYSREVYFIPEYFFLFFVYSMTNGSGTFYPFTIAAEFIVPESTPNPCGYSRSLHRTVCLKVTTTGGGLII